MQLTRTLNWALTPGLILATLVASTHLTHHQPIPARSVLLQTSWPDCEDADATPPCQTFDQLTDESPTAQWLVIEADGTRRPLH